MTDVFSKRPIDFSKYRELLSDDNPKIPDDQITRESFKQNQGYGIGSRSAGNLPRNKTTEPSTLDKEKKDDSQQSNKWLKLKDQVNMSSQFSLHRDEDVSVVNIFLKSEHQQQTLKILESKFTNSMYMYCITFYCAIYKFTCLNCDQYWFFPFFQGTASKNFLTCWVHIIINVPIPS